MNPTMIVLLLIHVISAVIWVGGMVFAHFMLRPASLKLDPALRLPLWRGVFQRFFPVVWVIIALLLLTGFGMIFSGFGGFAHAPEYINVMMGLGIVMMLAFGHLYSAPWRRMKRALDGGDLAAAGNALQQIRMIVVFNMYLGLIVVAVAATGPYWG
jgi:uncharacterized membrane protein